MKIEYKNMLVVIQLNEFRSQQWRAFKIITLTRVLDRQACGLGFCLLAGRLSEIYKRNRNPYIRDNHLERLPVPFLNAGTQHIVPSDYLIERLLERRAIKLTLDTERAGDIVS